MKFLKKYFAYLLIVLIVSILTWGRIYWYGDLSLSIATGDTHSYISASRAPLFSWKMFTAERMFTTNLVYKMANDPVRCPPAVLSLPASGEELQREISPCFDKVVTLQNLLSLFGWVFLAVAVAKQINHTFLKISSVILVLLFGYTPQLAEWDSVLGAEPLAFSFFSITTALSILMAFHVARSEHPFQISSGKVLGFCWITALFLWAFTRDAHLYGVLITFVFVAILLFIKKFRDNFQIKILSIVLLVIFILGYISAKASYRAGLPLINAIDEYIWPHPARVEFFREYGMPDRDAPNYLEWANKNAFTAYGIFLASHPGFIATTVWEFRDYFSSDFSQAYFPTDDLKYREQLLFIGKSLHLESYAVYLIDLILIAVLVIGAFQYRTADRIAWAWLALWMISVAAVTLFINFIGDIYNTRRHVMLGVEWLRLFMWIFLMPILDQYMNRSSEVVSANS